MNLLSYVLRRLLFGIFVFWSVVTITFILTHSLGGNIIVAWLGKAAALHPELAALYVAKYHLNDSIWVQYYYYLIGLLHGDFGFSPSRGFMPVLNVIEQTLPYTLQLVISAFIICMALGTLLGVLSARYNRTPMDEGIRGFYLVGYSSPPFFLAIILLMTFSYAFNILPSSGAFTPGLQQPALITGMPILDSLLEGNWAYFVSGVEHTILPSTALALAAFGVVTRVLRSSLLEIMHMNYIRTARAKGLDENVVFYKHAFRNALMPVVTLSSLILTWLITATIFVENVFAYPGMGQYVVSALASQDYPGVIATAMVFALTIVIGNLAVDLLYAVVDPQVRFR
jgi:peptide/nickel transport system permease protein